MTEDTNKVPWYDKSNGSASKRAASLDSHSFSNRTLLKSKFEILIELLEAYDAKCASLEEAQAMIEKFKAYNRNLWESFLKEQRKLHGT